MLTGRKILPEYCWWTSSDVAIYVPDRAREAVNKICLPNPEPENLYQVQSSGLSLHMDDYGSDSLTA